MARSFTRTSSQYLTADSSDVTGVPLTMACWFWGTAIVDGSGAWTAMCVGDSAANNKFFRIAAYQLKFIAQQSNSSGGFSQTASNITQDAWNLGVGVFAANNSRTAYLNAVAATENTTSVIAFTANQTRIGWRPGTGSADYWNGRIAHAAVWNVALTADEIASLYNSGIGVDPRSIRPDALTAYWPLLDNDGDRDWWRNAHLSAVNSPTYAQHPPLLMKSRPAYVMLGEAGAAPTISSVTVSGTRQIGNTLTATVATSPAEVDSIAYQWEASSTGVGAGADITGATASTLALTYDDFGPYLDTAAYVRCGAIATVGASSSDETFSDWQTVTVPSGGAAGGSLLESSLIR